MHQVKIRRYEGVNIFLGLTDRIFVSVPYPLFTKLTPASCCSLFLMLLLFTSRSTCHPKGLVPRLDFARAGRFSLLGQRNGQNGGKEDKDNYSTPQLLKMEE